MITALVIALVISVVINFVFAAIVKNVCKQNNNLSRACRNARLEINSLHEEIEQLIS